MALSISLPFVFFVTMGGQPFSNRSVFSDLLPTRYIQTKACVNSYIFPDNSNFCDFF